MTEAKNDCQMCQVKEFIHSSTYVQFCSIGTMYFYFNLMVQCVGFCWSLG